MADDGGEEHHDEVEIEDFEYDEETETFTFPCPCGDLFTIRKEDLLKGEEVAECPTCSLTVRVIFNKDEVEDIIKDKTKSKIRSPPETAKST